MPLTLTTTWISGAHKKDSMGKDHHSNKSCSVACDGAHTRNRRREWGANGDTQIPQTNLAPDLGGQSGDPPGKECRSPKKFSWNKECQIMGVPQWVMGVPQWVSPKKIPPRRENPSRKLRRRTLQCPSASNSRAELSWNAAAMSGTVPPYKSSKLLDSWSHIE
jgi:hypothetical protein